MRLYPQRLLHLALLLLMALPIPSLGAQRGGGPGNGNGNVQEMPLVAQGSSRALRSYQTRNRATPVINKIVRTHRPTSRIADQRPRAQLPDEVRQESAAPSGSQITPTGFGFEGLGNDDNAAFAGTRVVPADTQGDVGPDHYIQMINITYAVYDKETGQIVPGGGPFPNNALWEGFGGPCEFQNDGDPIVLYDHLADRWVFSQFAIPGNQCFAISKTNDPLGEYHLYQFTVSPGLLGLFPDINDYPKIGVWPDAYYASFNEFNGLTQDYQGVVVAAFPRADMLAGQAASGIRAGPLQCDSECYFSLQPSHLEGPEPPPGTPNTFIMAFDDQAWGTGTGTDGYRLWDFTVDWNDPPSSTFTALPQADTTPFNAVLCGGARDCIPQPAPGERVDSLSVFTMYRAQYRNWGSYETLVLNHTVDPGDGVAGIRWAELRKTAPETAWSVYQTGTYAPTDGVHRWMGSIAMDGAGNIGLGYSASSELVFPSIWYTTRTATDPLGVMAGGEEVMVAGDYIQTGSSNRWGDYSSMSIDPVDDCTFWYTQEFQADDGDGQTSFDFKTWIGSFKLPNCEAGPAPGIVRHVRVRLNGTDYLQLAEVEVLDTSADINLAPLGTPTQSSTFDPANSGPEKAIDEDTTSDYPASVAMTDIESAPWWNVDLGSGFGVGTITIYNRPTFGARLEGAVVEALDGGGTLLWSGTVNGAADGSVHSFAVTIDVTPPTADLADPASGSTIDPAVLNARNYIDVTFGDTGGSGLDLTTIDGNELALSGAGAGTATLGGVPTLVGGTTYRYAVTSGAFAEGPVNVDFIGGSFADNAATPNTNIAETESFTTATPPASGFVRKVRVRLTDTDYLQLNEVEVLGTGGSNLALAGTASQSSLFQGSTGPEKAIDGNTTSDSSVAITQNQSGAWWEVDLGSGYDVGTIIVYNRTGWGDRLEDAVVEALTSTDTVVWSGTITGATDGSVHSFAVVPDAMPPFADLTNPANGSTISLADLNAQGYLDVTFGDTGGSGVDPATVTDSDPELALSGAGAGTVVLDGVPTLVSGTTYRYAVTSGAFAEGLVNVDFIASSFTDNAPAPNPNVAETESFTTIVLASGFVRKVRVRLTDTDYLQLNEVEVLGTGGSNLAPGGTASQSSLFQGSTGPEKAIDGNTTSDSSVAITQNQSGAWWEVDLGSSYDVGTIIVYNRTGWGDRLEDAAVEALDASDTVMWSGTITGATDGSVHLFNLVPETTPPTADLADPAAGSTIAEATLNARGYLDVTFEDSGGSGLDTTTIDGDELTLTGTGAGTAALSGTAVLQTGTTYRYAFTGSFVVGTVDVDFVAGTFLDLEGNANLFETESFTVDTNPSGATFVRVRLTDTDYLQLAEVEVLEAGTGTNLALAGTATQSSLYRGNTPPGDAIDGNTTSDSSVAITRRENGAWWEVDLGNGFDIGTIVVYNRTTSGDRLEAAVVEALDATRNVTWSGTISGAADGSVHFFSLVPETTPPTADLADPVNGSGIAQAALNARAYIDVTFEDTGGSGLDTTTIDGDELALSGAGVGTAVLNGTAVLQAGTTFRYAFSGSFLVGTVNVDFVAGTFLDNDGNTNLFETESFTVDTDPSGVMFVRVRLTDRDYLQLAEVEVLDTGTGTNLALAGTATQSSLYRGNTPPEDAIDGNTTSDSSVAITRRENGAWWEVDLGDGFEVGTIIVYNRPSFGDRLENAVVEALDVSRNVVWSGTITGAGDGSIHSFVLP